MLEKKTQEKLYSVDPIGFKYIDELYQISECASFIKVTRLGHFSSVLKLIILIIYKCNP